MSEPTDQGRIQVFATTDGGLEALYVIHCPVCDRPAGAWTLDTLTSLDPEGDEGDEYQIPDQAVIAAVRYHHRRTGCTPVARQHR